MIVSHEHRFIFVKTRKTAGTSIEVFLSKLAGDDAIVTPTTPAVEGHHPRNYNPTRFAKLSRMRPDRTGEIEQPDRSITWREEIKQDFHLGRWYWNHMPARKIRARLGHQRWDSYFTFAFERNPWEKTISQYFWERSHAKDIPFREFVLRHRLYSDFDRYSLDGLSVSVDFVGRTERLNEDLRRVIDHLGIQAEVILGREKGNLRPPNATVADLFDAETTERVAEIFAREIAAFGFEPPHLRKSESP